MRGYSDFHVFFPFWQPPWLGSSHKWSPLRSLKLKQKLWQRVNIRRECPGTGLNPGCPGASTVLPKLHARESLPTGGPELSPHRDVGSATILKLFNTFIIQPVEAVELLFLDPALWLQTVRLKLLPATLLGLLNLSLSFFASPLPVFPTLWVTSIEFYAFSLLEITNWSFTSINQSSSTWYSIYTCHSETPVKHNV